MRPKPRRHPYTFGSDHGYTAPPHCKARNRQTIEEIINDAPRKSSLTSLSFNVKCENFGRGALYVSRIMIIAMAPNAEKYQNRLSFWQAYAE